MTFYIAGKITGDPDYKSKFDAMKGRILEAWPWCQVLSPADNPQGMSNADYMRLSFAMIDCADVVIFLPDWEESKGARIEKAYCEYIEKICVCWGLQTPLTCFSYYKLIGVQKGTAGSST